jgi:small subunit ribosomal protein S6
MMNIECDGKVLEEIVDAFRFSDAVLRHLVIKMDHAVTEASPMAKAPDEKDRGERDERDDRGERRERSERADFGAEQHEPADTAVAE